MKLLEYTPFDCVNVFLDQLNLGDCTIRWSLEAFSCKHAGNDRRLSISLEHEINSGIEPRRGRRTQRPATRSGCGSSSWPLTTSAARNFGQNSMPPLMLWTGDALDVSLLSLPSS